MKPRFLFRILALATLVWPLLVSIGYTLWRIVHEFWHRPAVSTLAMVPIAAVAFLLCSPRGRHVIRGASTKQFLVAVLGITFVVASLFASTFHGATLNDYRRYDDLATVMVTRAPTDLIARYLELAQDDAGPFRQLFSDVEGVDELPPHFTKRVFAERVFFSIYPAYLVGGPGIESAKAANIGFFLGTTLLLFWLVRRHASELAARGAVLLYVTFPLHYQFLTQPNHEVPGAFYLAAFLVIVQTARDRLDAGKLKHAAALSACIGFSLFVTDVQRSLAPALGVSLLCYAAYETWRHAQARATARAVAAPLVLALVPLTLYVALNDRARFIPLPDYVETSALIFASHETVPRAHWIEHSKFRRKYGTDGSMEFFSAYTPTLRNQGVLWHFALAKLLSEARYNTADLVRLVMVDKVTRLYPVAEGQDLFMYDPAYRSPVARDESLVRGTLVANYTHQVFVQALAVIGLVLAFKRGGGPPFGLGLVFVAVFIHANLLTGPQPRYSFVVVPLVCALGALGARFLARARPRVQFRLGKRLARDLCLASAATAGVVVLVLSSGVWLHGATPLAFADHRLFVAKEGSGKPGKERLQVAQDLPFSAVHRLERRGSLDLIELVGPLSIPNDGSYQLAAFVGAHLNAHKANPRIKVWIGEQLVHDRRFSEHPSRKSRVIQDKLVGFVVTDLVQLRRGIHTIRWQLTCKKCSGALASLEFLTAIPDRSQKGESHP